MPDAPIINVPSWTPSPRYLLINAPALEQYYTVKQPNESFFFWFDLSQYMARNGKTAISAVGAPTITAVAGTAPTSGIVISVNGNQTAFRILLVGGSSVGTPGVSSNPPGTGTLAFTITFSDSTTTSLTVNYSIREAA